MEEYLGNLTYMTMNRGFNSGYRNLDEQASKQLMDTEKLLSSSKESIVNDVFEAIRDAGSTENARAIQDSETLIAQEQKKLIKTLAKKGWSKNEIIYEVQRIYGNDVLIITRKLDDERGLIAVNKNPLMMLGLSGLLLLINMRRGIARRSSTRIA